MSDTPASKPQIEDANQTSEPDDRQTSANRKRDREENNPTRASTSIFQLSDDELRQRLPDYLVQQPEFSVRPNVRVSCRWMCHL